MLRQVLFLRTQALKADLRCCYQVHFAHRTISATHLPLSLPLSCTCAEERRHRGKPRGEVLELLAQRAQQLGGSAAPGLRKLAAAEADSGMEAGAPTGVPIFRV